MRLPVFVSLLVIAAAPASGSSQAARSAPGIVRVSIETTRGTIEAELDSAHAPRTVANFLRYVDAGAYANGAFHRTVTPANQPTDSVRIEVIQGGPNSQSGDRFPPIELERTSATGIHHADGTLSMARAGSNTATSDFFICIGAQPALDYGGHRNLDGQGFAAFGRVVRGMDVVRSIQQAHANGQRLDPPIGILGIHRIGAR